jgi:type I restriction enzyme R subunit
MLRGEEDYDPAAEEISAFETTLGAGERERPVVYNPKIPIETFDFVVTDECHRSIYKVWRQVLEYFDAHIIGLTATPSKLTLGFFGNNLVMTYPYERSVADGVNVGYEIYRIKTRVSEQGSRVEAGYALGWRDRRTRLRRWEELDQDFEYEARELDRSVATPDQIRTILKAYRDRLFTELFPGRDWVPKTLIFAKDDHHAEEITHIAREVFEQGNEFCKKITYQTSESPKELIKRFRTDPMPRIAVTVDMVATGTDVRPIEALIFMRDVRSEIYFEQMKGRGARTIQSSDLKQVTPDALAKTRFVLIDAVGVTETHKSDNQPLERKPGVAFAKLIEQVAMGRRDDDSLSSLAGRLAALERELDGRGQAGAEDLRRIEAAAGGRMLKDLANALLDAIDPDRVEAETTARFGPAPSGQQYAEIEKVLKEKACSPFDSPPLRRTLIDVRQKSEIAIDEITTDAVTYAGYDVERARELTGHFERFIEDNQDRLAALQILLGRPYRARRLTYAAIRELADELTRAPWPLDVAQVWQAYQRLDAARVRGAPEKVLTDLVALVRFAAGGPDEVLEPFSRRVEQRFNLWVGRQIKAGRSFTDEQIEWLRLIRGHIAHNAEVTPDDFKQMPDFTDRGGLLKARRVFGEQLQPTLDDLTEALVA